MFEEDCLDAIVTLAEGVDLLCGHDNERRREGVGKCRGGGECPDVLVVRRESIAEYSDQLTLLCEGWFRALRFLAEEPVSSAKHMAPRLQLSPDKVLAAYDGLVLPGLERNIEMLGGSGPSLEDSVARLAQVMVASSILDPQTRLENITNAEILMKVAATAGGVETADVVLKEQ